VSVVRFKPLDQQVFELTRQGAPAIGCSLLNDFSEIWGYQPLDPYLGFCGHRKRVLDNAQPSTVAQVVQAG
jgi:hypothetical protein